MNDPKLHSEMVGVCPRSAQRDLGEDGGGFHPLTIKLIDHTIIPGENSPALWARSAKVVDYVIISGSRTRAGAYVAWNCSIETFEVCLTSSGLFSELFEAHVVLSSFIGSSVHRSKTVRH